MHKMAREAGLETIDLAGQAVRIRRTNDLCFAFNYGTQASALECVNDADFILGSRLLEPAGVAIWRK
jgi:beta-galactosidase